jgi:type IV pilus assembly protein PilW
MRRAPSASRGMTLIEVLIAMTISLVVTLAVYQTFAASEGYRRSASAGGDAVFSGTVAMFALQRDARMAGFGLNTVPVLGCRVLAYDEGVVPAREFEFVLAPVRITQGADDAPDTLEFTYSNTDTVPAPIRLTQALPNAAATYHVDNAFGVVAGQLLIVAEPGRDCTLQQATNTPSLEAPGKQDLLIHGSGMYRTPYGTMAAARYNKPGGLGPNYTLGAVIFPIGTAPTVARYTVQGGTLVVDQVLQGNEALPVAADIVQMQAQYGKDTDADGAVDLWDELTPVNNNGWATVVAIRVGLVARSALPERPDPATGQCAVTTVAPQWTAGAFVLSDRPDWQCFRYRVFESTIGLRNMIWRPA